MELSPNCCSIHIVTVDKDYIYGETSSICLKRDINVSYTFLKNRNSSSMAQAVGVKIL